MIPDTEYADGIIYYRGAPIAVVQDDTRICGGQGNLTEFLDHFGRLGVPAPNEENEIVLKHHNALETLLDDVQSHDKAGFVKTAWLIERIQTLLSTGEEEE